jgi:hypothetical protein
MMLTTEEAFRKFKSGLELTQGEQDDAARRQKEIREVVAESFKLETDFLTGSYKRHTKTKRLKDVDIFCVLHDDERATYRNGKLPSVLLNTLEQVLVDEYGRERVEQQRRSVSVKFWKDGEDDRIMSFDVVPAFTKGKDYEIPDTKVVAGWTKTNPTVHADKATAAHAAFAQEWKGIVRMVKRWNREKGKAVKPSFLLEVMALDILRPPFGRKFEYEIMSYFKTAAERILEEWLDPAGLGPPVSDGMTDNEKRTAQVALNQAAEDMRTAINLTRAGNQGEALRKYQQIFGPMFRMS